MISSDALGPFPHHHPWSSPPPPLPLHYADAHVELPVRDAGVAVPPHFTQATQLILALVNADCRHHLRCAAHPLGHLQEGGEGGGRHSGGGLGAEQRQRQARAPAAVAARSGAPSLLIQGPDCFYIFLGF
jgi:hypothetical protein